ncbi:SHOCT domain-containing protein [Nesterenkonia natronophila]|uniref:SHOCT domain-containing protein n=1 Tax=Nesterenkonia natronophila TaxID=2174932 RepID=A0A3A4F1N9_9MICC|nr:SHOCT domain-containing protein [Nesterenkonia natronophila]RJN32172.1 SHOCT domain-containing protein [Nesterenkonia natronophila]
MGWNTDHMGWWPMVWGWFFLALIVLGIVVLVVALVRILGDRPQHPGARPLGRSRARELLDERYARGEIETAEYEERRQRLENET